MGRLKIKVKIMNKDYRHKNMEKLADVLNCIYEDNQTAFQFRGKYNEWSENFRREWKALATVKSDAMKNLKSSHFPGILVTAILIMCVLEYCGSSDMSYLMLSFSLYSSISVMTLVSHSRISYLSSLDKQTLEICHFFRDVFVMSQALESRLSTLRRRFKMNIHLPLDYQFKQECDFRASKNPDFFSCNITSSDLYGTFIGATTFLLCHFFILEVFDILEVFTLYFMFICAICYDIKISAFIKKNNQAKNTLNFVTNDFFTWYENDCELKKILQQKEIREDLSSIFHTTASEIQRNFRHLKLAILVSAIKDIRHLNLCKNDIEIVLMFLIHENFTALNEVSYKKLSTGNVMKCPLKVNYSNQDYLKANSSISTQNPATTETVLAKSRFTESKQFEGYVDQSDFVNRIKCGAKYEAKIDVKGATKYTKKLNSNSGAESESVAFKNGSQAKNFNSFDETLQLRPELRSSGSKNANISTEISNVTSSEFGETYDQDLFLESTASQNHKSSNNTTVSDKCIHHNYYDACCALSNLLDQNIKGNKTTLIQDNEEISEDLLKEKESKNVINSDKEEFLTNDDNLAVKVKNTTIMINDTKPSFDSGLNAESLLEVPETDTSEGSLNLVSLNESDNFLSDKKATGFPSLHCLVFDTQDLPNRNAEVLNTKTNLRQPLLPNNRKSETDKENAFVFGNQDSSACSKDLNHCYIVNEQKDELSSTINESLKEIKSDENEKILIDNTEEFNAEKTSFISSRSCTKKKQQSTRKKNSFGRKNKAKSKIKEDKMISGLNVSGGNLVNKLDDTVTLKLSDDLVQIKPENEPGKEKAEINDERCEYNFGTESILQPFSNSEFWNNSNVIVTDSKKSGETSSFPNSYTDLAFGSCADNNSTKEIVLKNLMNFEIKDENGNATSIIKEVDNNDKYNPDYSFNENLSDETSLRTVINLFSNKMETVPVNKDFVENIEKSKEKSYETKETTDTTIRGSCMDEMPGGDENSTDSNTSLVKNLRKFTKGKRRFNHLPLNVTTGPSINTFQNENVRKNDQTKDYHEDKHVKDNSIDNCSSKENHGTSLNERKIWIPDNLSWKNSENESQNFYSDKGLSQEDSETFNKSPSCNLTTESQYHPEQKTNDIILDSQCNLEHKTSQVLVNNPAVDESGYVQLKSENEATEQIKIENTSRTESSVLEHLDRKNTNYIDAEDVEHDHTRMKLHYLWKTEERSQIVERFPKHKFGIKRIIGRLEKQLGCNKNEKAYCLSTTSIEDSKIPFDTIDESGYYLKCSSTETFEQYGSTNEHINREESTQNWIKSQAITNEHINGPSNNTEPFTPAPPRPANREEPEKIQIWLEEQQKMLEVKDEEEEKKKGELRKTAQKELDDWYARYKEQIGKSKLNNRYAEKEWVADRDTESPGQEWERIARLCDFNPKSSRSTKDTSRMRSIILQLKQSPIPPRKA